MHGHVIPGSKHVTPSGPGPLLSSNTGELLVYLEVVRTGKACNRGCQRVMLYAPHFSSMATYIGPYPCLSGRHKRPYCVLSPPTRLSSC